MRSPVALLSLCSVLLAPTQAPAQPAVPRSSLGSPSAGQSGPATRSATPAPAEPRNSKSQPRLTGVLGPFDPRDFVEGWELEGAILWARASDSQEAQRGWEVSAVGTSQTIQHGLSLSGTMGPVLRYLGDGDFSATLSRHRIVGGLAMGALEFLGGFGFSTLTVDRLDDEWGIGLLAPLSAASVALRIGRARIEVGGYTEYLWRWNAKDYWVRGISLALRVQR